MKIISKSFFCEKSIIKFFLCFFLLIIVFLFLIQIRTGVIMRIEEKKNSMLNQEIMIKLKDNDYFEKIKNNKYIENIQEHGNNEYILKFSKYKYIDDFINEYENYFLDIVFFKNDGTNANEQELLILNSLEIGLTYLIVIFMVVILVLLILLMIEISVENKNIISYYKLIGYKNFSIIKYLFICLFAIFLILVILAISINNVITFILINIFNNHFLYYITNYTYIYIFSFILFFLIIISCIFYFKIHNVTPIGFKNKNCL